MPFEVQPCWKYRAKWLGSEMTGSHGLFLRTSKSPVIQAFQSSRYTGHSQNHLLMIWATDHRCACNMPYCFLILFWINPHCVKTSQMEASWVVLVRSKSLYFGWKRECAVMWETWDWKLFIGWSGLVWVRGNLLWLVINLLETTLPEGYGTFILDKHTNKGKLEKE